MRVPTWQRDGHIVLGKRRGTIEPVDRALTRELEHELSALASQQDPADAFGGVAGFVEPLAIVPFDRVGSREPIPAPQERSEGMRGGQTCVRTRRSRWSPSN